MRVGRLSVQLQAYLEALRVLNSVLNRGWLIVSNCLM